jgi:predicted TIM-barrel fold metal-dependent hydrolase
MASRRFLIRHLQGLAYLAAGVFVLAACAQRPGGPPLPSTRAPLPWIDVHLHLIGEHGPHGDLAGAVGAAIEAMDRFGIAAAIVLPPPQVDGQAVHDASAYVSALQRHRGRFAHLGGGGTLNAFIHRHADTSRVTDAVKRRFVAAAERIIESGAVGFGEMASLHLSATMGHPYEFVPADHPLFRVLADVAAKREVPIDLHMDAVEGETPTPSRFPIPPNPPKLADTMEALARLLASNPQARIVWAHGGSDPLGAMTPAAIGRLMDEHPNLFVSLRIVGPSAPMMNKALADTGLDPAWKALLTRHTDRFVIGTDSFMVSPDVHGGGPGVRFAERNTPKLHASVHFLSLLPLDMATRIGRDNALRIYRLPPG